MMRFHTSQLPLPSPATRAFSLVEAAISTIIVATMFAAGLAASGAAARDRLTQREIRTGSQLARMLMAEILQQRYADPSANTIAPAANASTTDRSNWTHIDDYASFSETTPKDRAGTPIPGCAGWTWASKVTYQTFGNPGGTASPGGGLLGGILSPVTGVISSIVDGTTDSLTDTGLKRIRVTITSPRGKVTQIVGYRSSAGAVDRLSTGFYTYATISATVGSDARPVSTGAPLLNTPPSP